MHARVVAACLMAMIIAALAPSELRAQGLAPFRQQTLVTKPLLPQTRVEAGVTMYEHIKDAFLKAPQLVLVGPPVTVVNGASRDGAYDLTETYSYSLHPDGRITAYSFKSKSLLVFGGDGRDLKTIGREGGGPGEFKSASIRHIAGDTLLVMDDSNNRWSWITLDKGFVKALPMSREATDLFGGLVGTLPRGRLLVSGAVHRLEPQGDSVKRQIDHLAAIEVDGRVTELTRLTGSELRTIETNYRGRKGTTNVHPYYGRRLHSTVWDTLIVSGNGDGFRLDVRNGSGKLVASLRAAVSRRPITPAMREAIIAPQLARMKGPASERMVDPRESERIVRATPFADSLPPYHEFFVSPNKTLWVVDGMGADEKMFSATAFRMDGAIVGRLSANIGGIPVAFGDDRVLVRSTDADGVVSLSVHRIGVK